MNSHDPDLITSLYDYEDAFASSYSTSFDEELELSSSKWEEEEVDPFMYYSAKYFAFARGTYALMRKDLLGQVKVTFETLSTVARGAPLNLDAWRCMKSHLMLGNEGAIYLKASPNLQVIYVEN